MKLADRLTRYLESRYPDYVASGELQKLTIERAGQTGKTCTRRLQELAADGVLEVQYREKHHAFYRAKKGKVRQMVEQLPDGRVRLTYAV